MSKTIDKIVEKLKNHPDCDYELFDNSLTVKPNDDKGFPVTITAHEDNAFMVAYDFWHEEFDKENEALNCFVFGLTTECRLKLTKRGQKPFKWTVEYNDKGTWKEDSTTGVFNLAFWKSTNIEYLQNNLIKNEK